MKPLMHRLLPLALLAVIPAASADFLGLYVGTHRWVQDWDGNVQAGLTRLQTREDLGFEDSNGSNIYVAFEHPLPFLPNVRVQSSEIEINDRSRSAFVYDGRAFVAGDRSSADLSHVDATAYYELIDTVVSIDIGLTARQFSGYLRMENDADKGEIDIDSTIPLLYGALRFALPFTGLSVGGSVNTLVFDNVSMNDWNVQVSYESDLGLGLEAGFRSFGFQFDDDDEEADITVDGGYLGVFFHF